MKTTLLLIILLCAGLFCSLNSYANTYYWTGSTNSNWSTLANWNLSSCGGSTPVALPGTGDSVVFSGGCSNNNCTIDVAISILSFRIDDSYSGTISQSSGNAITATYGKFADGTFAGSSAAITFSSLIIEGGTFTTTSGTTTIKGNFSYTGGTFNANNGRVVFYKTLTVSGVNSSSSISLYDVEFQAIAGNTTVTLSNIILNVADSTLLTGSEQLFIDASQSTSVINASGEVKDYNTSGTGGGDATIVVNGSSTQHITGNVTTEDVGKLPNLTINSTGSVYLIGFITIGGSTTLTYTAGTINAGTSDVVFYYDNTITGSMTFNNVEFQGTGSTCVVSNTITVNGKMSITGTSLVVINSGTINLYANLYISNTAYRSTFSGGGSTILNLTGSANDSIISTVSAGQGLLGNITINKTGGTLYLDGTISVINSWMNYTPTADINPGTSTLAFCGIATTVDIGGTYPTPAWIVSFGAIGNLMNVNDYDIQADSALSVRHSLVLAGGITQEIDGNSINILGNINITNTAFHDSYYGGGSTILNLVGSANDSIISTVSLGEGLLGEVSINKTGGVLYLSGNISVANSWMNYSPSSYINPGTSTLGFASINGGTIDIGGTYPTPVWDVSFGAISVQYFDFYDIQSDSAFTVLHTMYLAGTTTQEIDGNSINIRGNINITNTAYHDGYWGGGSTVLNLVGSVNDSIISTVGLGEGSLGEVAINKTGGTLYLSGNIGIVNSWMNYTPTADINPGTSTLGFASVGEGAPIYIGGTYPTPVWDVNFGALSNQYVSTYDIQIDSAFSVRHSLIISNDNSHIFNGHSFDILGNINITNTATYLGGGSSIFYFNNSANDSIIAAPGVALDNGKLPIININKSGGTLYLGGNISLANNWVYLAGTVNAGTSTVGNYGGGTITCTGSSSSMSFNNLVIASTTTLAGGINVLGNLTINSGETFSTSSSDYPITLAGNLIDNGTFDTYHSDVTFNGSSTDSIQGSSSTEFYSLTLNKTGTLYLADPVTVVDSLNLTSGDILSSSTDLLTLNNGSLVTGGSDNSFVNGPIKKIGNGAFSFPTGVGSSYHPIGITAPSSTSDAFEAQYFNTAPTGRTYTDDSLTYVSACDYWLLSQPTGSSSSVTVSLFWGTNSCDIKRLSSLRVGYFNTSGSKWTDLGQSATTGTTTSGSVTAVTTSSLSTTADTFAISKHSPTPTVSAGSPTTTCYGTSTDLNATATGGFSPYTYSWSPATGLSSSTAANPSAAPTATTTYTVTVEDNDNAPTANRNVVITVNPLPTIAISASSDSIYSDSSSTLTASGAITYTWSPSIGLSATTGSLVTATLTATTTYTITGTDENGCVNTAAAVVVVVAPLSVNPGRDTILISPVTYTLGGSPTASGGIPPYTYSWYPSTYLSDSTIANPILSDTTNGTLHYVLTVTDSKGYSQIKNIIDIVDGVSCPNPPDNYFCLTDINNTNQSCEDLGGDQGVPYTPYPAFCLGICQGDSIELSFLSDCVPTAIDFISTFNITDITPGYGNAIVETLNNLNLSNPYTLSTSIMQPGHTYQIASIDSFGYIVDNGFGYFPLESVLTGCFFLEESTTTADFTLDKTTACPGEIITAINIPILNLNNPNNIIWWTFEDSSDSLVTPPYSPEIDNYNNNSNSLGVDNSWAGEAFAFCTPGTYQVCMHFSDDCIINSDSAGYVTVCKEITIEQPADSFTYTENCAGVVNFSADFSCTGVSNSTLTVTWNFGDGDSITGSSSYLNASHTYLHSGTDTVTLVIADTITDTTYDDICTNTYTSSKTITVNPSLSISANPSATICSGGSTTLTASGGSGSYTWAPSTDLSATTGGSSIIVSLTTATNYTVKDASGCTTTIEIIVDSPPTITVTPGSTSICPGSCAALAASGAGVYVDGVYHHGTYAWTPSTGLNSTSDSSVSACPTVTTTYTVSGTQVGDGCTNTATAVVTVHSISPPKINSTDSIWNACAGSGSFTITNAEDGVTYNWYLNGSYVTTGTSATLTYSNVSENQTIVVSDTNSSGCSFSDTVTVYACCGSTSYGGNLEVADTVISALPSIADSDGLNSYIYEASGTPNSVYIGIDNDDYTLYFNGKIKIDENTYISAGGGHANLYLGPNAQIYIEPGDTLYIEHGVVLTDYCSYMWQGIYIDGNTASLVVNDNCYINEADTAVYSHNGGVYTIEDVSLIQDNYIGIECDAYSGNHQGTISNSGIEGNPFDLLDPPHSTEYSAIGMIIRNVQSITVGTNVDSDYHTNSFSWLSIGVQIFNSDVNFYNNNFSAIYYPNSKFPITQVAIVDTGNDPLNGALTHYSNLNVLGISPHGVTNSFAGCYYGIVTYNSVTPVIKNNLFDSLRVCVDIQKNNQRSITINSNAFEDIKGPNVGTVSPQAGIGVEVFNTIQPIALNIDSNSFSTSANTLTYGVYLNTNAFPMAHGIPAINNFKVSDNTISGFAYGVYLNSSGYVSIANNPAITVPSLYYYGSTLAGTPASGIGGDNSTGCQFKNNIITGQGATTRSRGIYMNACTGSSYLCNTANNCNVGMGFVTPQTSILTGNAVGGSYYGVELLENGLIGPQGSSARPQWNKWFFPDSSGSDLYTFATDASSGTWYYSNSGAYIPNSKANVLSQAIPIAIASGTTPPDPCPSITARDAVDSLEIDTTVSDSSNFNKQFADSIVLDSIKYVNYAAEATWMSKENLVYAMLQDTAWKSDTLLTHFYDTIQSKNIGLIARLIYAIDTDTTVITLEGLVHSHYAGLAAEEALVAAISPTNMIEQNYQTVYNIYVNYMLNNTNLDSTQLNALESVASQCFYTGGAVVFMARGILQGLSVAPADSQYQFYFIDSSLCVVDSMESMHIKIKQPDSTVVAPSFVNAYPNPAKDQINFVYQYTGNDNAMLAVYNILGVQVGEYTLTAAAKLYTLGLNNFSSGLYFYRLMTPCCEVGMGKFVVAK